jgi:dihydrofolate synthase/folylpolyglutamate synthase
MTDRITSEHKRRFDEAVHWIESFIRPITGTAPQKTRADWYTDGPGRLDRMATLLTSFGHPERRYETLHVTGTSGKGSVCTYLGSVLQASGRRTGVHATPYLQTPVEKLQVDGRYASSEELAGLVDEFRSLLPEGRAATDGLPYPALWVALTYLYFARKHVDSAVIEVSTGGRFDWTNTLNPRVTVVTTVGPDHLMSLGPSLADVAYHKAGIIKPGTPSVTGVHLPERLIIEQEADRQCSPLLRLGVEFDYSVRRCTESGTIFDFESHVSGLRSCKSLEIGMLGRYQAFNAALATAALGSYGTENSAIDEDALRTGLRDARLPGRMELIQRGPDVLLDGAHNPEKAAALADSIAAIFPDRRLLLVIGALSTKDVSGILEPFAGMTRTATLTIPHVLGKSGLDPERMARTAAVLGINAHVEPDPAVAVQTAMASAGPDDLVLVTGSLYLVGEVRRLWVPDEQVLATGYSTPAGATSAAKHA